MRPFPLGLGLLVLAAAVGAGTASLYRESATDCGPPWAPAVDALCYEVYLVRQRVVLTLLAVGAVLVLVALLDRARVDVVERGRRAGPLLAALPGLAVVPVATAVVVGTTLLEVAVLGGAEGSLLASGVAPAGLGLGLLLAAGLAGRAGVPLGAALAACALALPLALAVVVLEVRFTPTSLAGLTGSDGPLLPLLASLPAVLLLALAARLGTAVPPAGGALLLGLAALAAAPLTAVLDGLDRRGPGLLLLGGTAAAVLGAAAGLARLTRADAAAPPALPRRPAALLAAVAVAVAGVGAGAAVAEPRLPDLRLGTWDPADVGPGLAAAVFAAGADRAVNGCALGPTGVAASSAGAVWVSTDTCLDRGASGSPRHTVHRLLPDGSTRLGPSFPSLPDPFGGGRPPRVVAALGERVWALDADGTLLSFADGDGSWRTVLPGGDVHAGDGGPAARGSTDRAVDADVAPNGTVLVAEAFAVRRVGLDGTLTTVAGSDPREAGRDWGAGAPYAGPELDAPVDARSAVLPALTGVVVAPDGGAYLVAIDSVLRLDAAGRVRTLVRPGLAPEDRATRLERVSVEGGSDGSSLRAVGAVPGGVLVADAAAGRLLRIGDDGTVTRVAGGDANAIGGPVDTASLFALRFREPRPADLLPLAAAGALLPEGDALLAAGRFGLLRVGLPE